MQLHGSQHPYLDDPGFLRGHVHATRPGRTCHHIHASMAVEARLVASLQTGLESRVPVAVGVYRGEVIVACPGGAVLDTKASITLHRIYSRNKEVK